jgi:hypothetical protein
MPADRPLGGRPRLGVGHRRGNPHITKGAFLGVVWGEGVSNQRGPAAGSGISGWVERLIRAAWQRIFMHSGDA